MNGIGWWAEQYAYFGIELSPAINIAVASSSTGSVNVFLNPAITMGGVGISVAAMNLSATPLISFAGESYAGVVALELSLIVGMEAATHSTTDFTLNLTPNIGMVGNELYYADFGITLTPTLTATAYIKQLPHPVPWTL